jgi:hypothetical protein
MLEILGQRDDGADDRLVLDAEIDVAHESLVDLDLVEGECPQVAQRRVPGAEIVQRDLHAKLAQGMERADIVLGLVHQDAFDDLDLQAAGGRAATQPGAPTTVATSEGFFICAGDRLTATGTSSASARLFDSLADHPLPQRNDDAGLFGAGDEHDWAIRGHGPGRFQRSSVS